MRVFRSVDVAGSALTAHRVWMDAISSNLANANTTRTPEGGPYVRRVPVFQERLMEALKDGSTASGVKVVSIERDPLPPRMVYQPDHPDANPEGYVAYPNVNVVREMADMMVASRAYEANLTVVETGKAMWNSALEIMRG
ncbi:MAG: flagellar basal body rod protein FlgC [Thermanaerothrix sp.]|nr:flagellar basal body rod protein FlgC [Thermanaerothrix sp.]